MATCGVEPAIKATRIVRIGQRPRRIVIVIRWPNTCRPQRQPIDIPVHPDTPHIDPVLLDAPELTDSVHRRTQRDRHQHLAKLQADDQLNDVGHRQDIIDRQGGIEGDVLITFEVVGSVDRLDQGIRVISEDPAILRRRIIGNNSDERIWMEQSHIRSGKDVLRIIIKHFVH